MKFKEIVGWIMFGLFALVSLAYIVYLIIPLIKSWVQIAIPLGIVGYIILMIFFITDY